MSGRSGEAVREGIALVGCSGSRGEVDILRGGGEVVWWFGGLVLRRRKLGRSISKLGYGGCLAVTTECWSETK